MTVLQEIAKTGSDITQGVGAIAYLAVVTVERSGTRRTGLAAILDVAHLHVDRIPADLDLVAQLRVLHAEGVEIPCAWSVTAGPEDLGILGRVTLDFGINGDLGMVRWLDADRHLVPRDGRNPHWSIYHLGGMHDTPIPPNAEVPLETVCSVLDEFLRTRLLPTAIEWQDAAAIESMFGEDLAEETYSCPVSGQIMPGR